MYSVLTQINLVLLSFYTYLMLFHAGFCQVLVIKSVKSWEYEMICTYLKIIIAGPKYEYHWADGQTVKKPIKCSAPKYIDYLMTWVQDQLDDESLFPSKIGVKFPPNFQFIVKTILKRLFRVYAHIYHQHFKLVYLNINNSTDCNCYN
jgi:hypothetical protein